MPRFQAQLEGASIAPVFKVIEGRLYAQWQGSHALEWPLGQAATIPTITSAALSARASLARIVAEHRRK